MLIDWVTARAPFDAFSAADWDKLRLLGDRIQRLDPRTGELRWETSAWDSIRSDSHGLSYRCGSDAFWFQGSPARVIGDGDNTFSSGAAAALDLAGCVRRMRDFVLPVLGVSSPPVERCVVSRVDVTANLLLSGSADVRAALAVLRNCEGGRYRVSQQAGDTVYWGGKSRLMKGKAYAKGPHLEYQLRNKNYRGPEYSPEQLTGANALLRLECTIGAQWWRERAGKHWLEMTAEDLRQKWRDYFERMLGTSEITEMNIEQRVSTVAKTEGQAKAAIGCWAMIKAYGWEKSRAMSSPRTWYRNLAVLRAAGLSDADLSAGTVVPFRRSLMEFQMVESWDHLQQLRRLAA